LLYIQQRFNGDSNRQTWKRFPFLPTLDIVFVPFWAEKIGLGFDQSLQSKAAVCPGLVFVRI